VRLTSWQAWRGRSLSGPRGGCLRAGALAAGQPAEAGGKAAAAAANAQAAEASGAGASAGVPAAEAAAGAEAEGAADAAADAPSAAAGAEAAGAAGPGDRADTAGASAAAAAGGGRAAGAGAPAAAAPAQAADPPAKIGYRTFRSGNEASAYFQDLIHNLTRDQDLNEARPARWAPCAAHARWPRRWQPAPLDQRACPRHVHDQGACCGQSKLLA